MRCLYATAHSNTQREITDGSVFYPHMMSAANSTQPHFPSADLSSNQQSSTPRIILSPPYTSYSILRLLLMCSMAYFFRLAWPFSWPSGTPRRSIDLLTTTAEDLQQLLAAGELTSVELVDRCFAQIDRHDDYLRAVLQRNPQARTVAATLDLERKNGRIRGALHGIPILIKVFFTFA